MENSRLRNLLDEYSTRIDQLLEDRAELQRRLHAMRNSTSWRITAPLRKAVIAIRVTLKLVSDSVFPRRKLKSPSHTTDGVPDILIVTEAVDYFDGSPNSFESGWSGGRSIEPQERYHGEPLLVRQGRRYAIDTNSAGRNRNTTEPLHQRLGSGEMIRHLFDAVSSQGIEACGRCCTLVLVTDVRDLLSRDLGQVIQAVAELVERSSATNPACRIHWKIVATVDTAQILALVEELRRRLGDHASVESCDSQSFVSASVPEATWILPLAAHARVSADAVDILIHYISAFPQNRMIVAPTVIEQADGTSHQTRVHVFPTTRAFENDFLADSALAIRADIFIAKSDSASTLLTLPADLVLRVAGDEPILAIPEPLLLIEQGGAAPDIGAMAVRRARSRFLRHCLAADPCPGIFKREMRDTPRGFCVIRTQGNRMGMLREAVESVMDQSLDMIPCIVVHAPKEIFASIATLFSTHRSVVVLSAPDTRKKRAYPCNVALSYLKEHRDAFDFLCFLDDDDLLYPVFSERLVDSLRHSRADIAFGISNAISRDQAICVQHTPLPPICLCAGNFIPINSFVMRADTVLTAMVQFDETLEYLEDWDFLLTLMASGARFVPIFETVSAYRLDSGSDRNEGAAYASSHRSVSARGRDLAKTLGARAFWRDILDFPEEHSTFFGPAHISQIEATLQLTNSPSW